MKITAISDTHNKHKQIELPGGHIIIHSGDATGRGKSGEIEPFLKWYGSQDYMEKIFIPGNHDFGFETEPERYREMCEKYDVTLLIDEGVVVKNKYGESVKIWGSPVTPEFFNWAFNRRLTEKLPDGYDPYHSYNKVNSFIKPHWDMIPEDIDILVTHGPPKTILDECQDMYNPSKKVNVGCPYLLDAVKKIKPKLHIFGHIHEQHGIFKTQDTVFCNAAQLNDKYNVHYKSKDFLWEKGQLKLK